MKDITVKTREEMQKRDILKPRTNQEILDEWAEAIPNIVFSYDIEIMFRPEDFFTTVQHMKIQSYVTGEQLEITVLKPHVCNCQNCRIETEESKIRIERKDIVKYEQRLIDRDRPIYYAIPIGKLTPVEEVKEE